MFGGPDPISEEFPHVSSMNYAENSPVANIDLHGLQATSAVSGIQNLGRNDNPINSRVDPAISDKSKRGVQKIKESIIFEPKIQGSLISVGAGTTIGPFRVNGEASAATLSIRTDEELDDIAIESDILKVSGSLSLGEARVKGTGQIAEANMHISSDETTFDVNGPSGTRSISGGLNDINLSLNNSTTLAVTAKISAVKVRVGVNFSLFISGMADLLESGAEQVANEV